MNNIFSRQTPYDDDYGTCLETRATLLVYPKERHPDEITQLIGIEPTRCNVKGEEIINSIGRKRVTQNNGWFLSSEGRVDSLDVRRHLDWLIAQLAPKVDILVEIQNIQGIKMAVVCAWYSRSGHGGPTIWPEQMEALARLNLELSFDVYFLPDEDDAE
jgi:hypothetical protein